MRKLVILFILAGFFLVNCAGTYTPRYNPSSKQFKKDRKAFEQRQRDKVQRDILKQLKELNKRK